MSTNQLNHNKFRFILLRGVLGWGNSYSNYFSINYAFDG